MLILRRNKQKNFCPTLFSLQYNSLKLAATNCNAYLNFFGTTLYSGQSIEFYCVNQGFRLNLGKKEVMWFLGVTFDNFEVSCIFWGN